MIVRRDLTPEAEALITRWIEMRSVMSDDEKSVLRRLRPELQALVLKFPPGCVVSGNRVIGIPAPGRFGVVLSYLEAVDGSLLLRVGDLEAAVNKASAQAGECRPDWLDVAAYRVDRTPSDIMGVIGH